MTPSPLCPADEDLPAINPRLEALLGLLPLCTALLGFAFALL
jgi:hypothetical protein